MEYLLWSVVGSTKEWFASQIKFCCLCKEVSGVLMRIVYHALFWRHLSNILLAIGILVWVSSGIVVNLYMSVLSVFAYYAVALTFFWHYKRSDWCFCACAINVKSSMCGKMTKHFCMYITSQQIYLSQINTRQTSFEACFDSMRKSCDCSAP